MKKLTNKQEKFCLEYIKDLNATRAAIRAGYSEKTAYSHGQRLLKNVELQKKIGELRGGDKIEAITTFEKNLSECEEMKNKAREGGRFSSFARLLDIQNKMLGFYEQHNSQRAKSIIITESVYDGSNASDSGSANEEASPSQ